MPNPYGLPVMEGCATCKLRAEGFLCQQSKAALQELDAIRFTSTYPQGAVLFMEKQSARGVYILCQGQVKLSISSSEGKTLILRIAKPGDVLGLAAALAGSPYGAAAEVVRPCQVAFVRREDFIRFMGRHPEIYQAAMGLMVSQYRTACEQIRTLGLSGSVTARVARLLLEWSANAPHAKGGGQTTLPLTHEEIAEFVGTTRESVTRTLSEFKHRQLIEMHGSAVRIPDRVALEECANQ